MGSWAVGQLVPVGETVTACLAWAAAFVQRAQVPSGIEVLHEARDTRGAVCAQEVQVSPSSPLGSGDRRPSFQVFGGQNPHWYCYTSQQAGDLFDFFCVYYQLSQQEAWQWLQAGRFV